MPYSGLGHVGAGSDGTEVGVTGVEGGPAPVVGLAEHVDATHVPLCSSSPGPKGPWLLNRALTPHDKGTWQPEGA